MEIVFHPDVDSELNEAVEFYEQCGSNLGEKFINDTYSTLDMIAFSPESFPKRRLGTRSKLLNEFPFQVIYRVKSNTVFVYSISHTHRKPYHWKDRL